MDKIPEIDIEILGILFPGINYQQIQHDENNLVRAYKLEDTDVVVFIGAKDAIRFLTETFQRLMLLRKDFNLVITNHCDCVIIVISKSFLIRVIFEKRNAESNSEMNNSTYFDDDSDEDDSIAFTNGKWSPCPYCGSKRISTFMDGTAQCDDCKREFRYM